MMEILGQLIFGWLLADLLGGIFHWWEDRIANEDMWFIGNYIVKPNRHHHKHPLDMMPTIWGRNNGAWILLAVVLAGWVWLWGPSVILFATVVGLAVSTEVHYLTHQKKSKNVVLKILHDIGIVQSATHHMGHHRYEDRRYCVLTNFVNPVLDNLGVWQKAEKFLGRL